MTMGDGILTLAAQKLTDFLIQEATFLLGVKDDMVSIKDELILMQSFLKDAEQRQGTNERIRWWVAEIRSIAYKVEDIIDDYYTEVKGKEPSKRKLFNTSIQKCFCVAGETNVYDIGKEIKAIKGKLSDISHKREVYGINNIGNTQEIANARSQEELMRQQRRTTFRTNEEHFVGFDDDIVLLTEKLLSNEWSRSVISIYGMGGLGKTSLARKLYNTNKDSFQLHGWVCVSQEWNTRDLLEKIIKSLKEPTYEELKFLKNLNECDMERHLHKLLKDKRYLLVIDDTWDEDVWVCLRSALPYDKNRSRVIITTRNELVAEPSDEFSYVHSLRRLQKDESWELFCKKAFPKQNGACPEDLETIGKEMVALLDGLPLAINVLGGLLSKNQSREWPNIKRRIFKELNKKSIHISALLDLSYDDLSRELKSCFLYLGIFPEDYAIDTRKLVQLWIAEDLIPPSEGWNLEELAESYLKELNAKSLIQLITNEYTSNSAYRVDDLLRDLAVNKAKELELFHIYDESVTRDIRPFSTRRIAFRSGFEKYDTGFEKYDTASDDHSLPQVHTLSFLNYNSCLDVTKVLTLIDTRFKSLRVLDLEGVKIETTESKLKLFEAMRKLVYLRYLGIDELPESIGNMPALQVVDVFNGSIILYNKRPF